MADTVVLNPGVGGVTAATDDIGGVHHQRVKLSVGADGAASDAIPVSNGLDTAAAGVPAVGLVAQLDDVATGAVTENQFAPVRLSTRRALLVEGVASGTAVPVSAASLPSHDVTNAGTFAVQVSSALPAGNSNIGDVDVASLPGTTLAGATKQELDFDSGAGTQNTPLVGIALPGAGGPVAGGTSSNPLQVSLANTAANATAVKVDGSAVTQPVSGTVTANLAAGTNNIGDVDVLTVPADPFGANADAAVAAGAAGSIQAKLRRATQGLEDLKTLIVLAAGANAIGKLAANSGVDIGDVDVTSVNGFAAHDGAAAGTPLLVAGSAQDTDDTAPPNRVSAESDATRFATDRDGSVFVRPHGPQVWSYHVDGSSALTDATVHAAPGAGLSLYVTDIMISLGAATALNVFFEEGATKVLGPWYLEAINGRSMHIRFGTPKKITANTALIVTTSAAVAHTIDVTGFTAQG